MYASFGGKNLQIRIRKIPKTFREFDKKENYKTVACMNIEMRLQKGFGFIVLKRAPEQSLLFLVL